MCFATKEKKQKSKILIESNDLLNSNLISIVMRLGKKKEKDRDVDKEQCIDGVARLICSAKQSHPVPLRG